MATTESPKSNRRTIGAFVSNVGRVWGLDFMAGITDAAEAHDVNLVCFVGGRPTAIITPGQMAPSYGLYDLSHTKQISGLILAADLGHDTTVEELKAFSDRYNNVPIVANALNIPGIPNLLSENIGGMRAVVRHLIEKHNYKKIAFICGPKRQMESEHRLFAYSAELESHGIAYDEKLVVQGDFSSESGRAAIRKLLDSRKVKFDAVVAANDRMAFGAMEALRSRGYNIPADVAVTGFDDIREAHSLGVPLTTVRQSFYENGRRAVDTLLELIDGKKVDPQTTIPTELVVRWSCGCLPQSVKQAHVAKEEVARTGKLENKRDSATRAMLEAAGVSLMKGIDFRNACGVAWDAFLASIQTDEVSSDAFLNAIERAILALQRHSEDAATWHNVISTLRRHALAGISEKNTTLQAENLFQQARLLVGELSQRLQAYKRMELEQQEQVLQAFSFSMAPAMSLQEIGAAIQHNFPSMGIDRLYVMFYDEAARPQSTLLPPSQHYHMFMQYENEHLEMSLNQPRLSTGQLIPHESDFDKRRFTAVVMPLTLAKSRFGFMWMEMKERDWEVYIRVRNLLSSALLRTMLVDQREYAQHEVERLLDEAKDRAEELDRLYQSEQERRKDAEALSKAARNLSTLLKLDEVPEQILVQLQQVLPYERGSLMMEQMDGNVHILAQRGFPEDPRVDSLQVVINRGGVYDQIARTSEPVIIEDVTTAEGWNQVEWLPLNHSWMGVPLFSKNKVIGMLSLTRPEKAAFSQDDLLLASTFAMQAAIALENARLYQEVTQFNELMERMVSQRVEELNNAYVTLEKLNKNKTSFIQVAAHELRTPITIMKGYLGMLKGNPSIQEQEGLNQAVDGVMKGTDRLHQIVNSMLDVAKLESQTITPHMEPIILGLVLQMVQKEYKNDLKERNITLSVESGISQVPQLFADQQLLQKALDCVIVNAIKFTPDGGHITISGEVVEDDRIGRCAEIRIHDTGIGIDPANHKVIFEKLHQVGKVELHSSGRTKFKGGGPGLGLAIAAGIVKAHHGKIWVESPAYDEEKLPGSTFFIRIPLAK